MISLRRLRVPSILLLALVAALAFAATASAETLTGEASRPAEAGAAPEAEITGGKASYDTVTGAIAFSVNTAAEPLEEPGGSSSDLVLEAVLVHVTGTCDASALGSGRFTFPAFEIQGNYATREAQALSVANSSGGSSLLGPASMTVAGNTTNVSATFASQANQAYNCAFLNIQAGPGFNPLVFSISGPPPAPVVTTPAPAAPAPAAALSFFKPKSLSLKAGKWQKENIKIANTGTAAAGPISIKLKAPAGVTLQPASGTLKLPALLQGQSWTVTFKVKVTAKAKKSSTISVTGAGPGINATSSFTIKRLG